MPSPLIQASQTGAGDPPPPDPGPLPAPEALTDVIARLADPAVPGADKLTLVESTTPADAATLDSFAGALRDTGLTPVTVRAADLRWLGPPGGVVATITISGPESAGSRDGAGEFSFPMEFRRAGTGWQLTRLTADMLLAFGGAHGGPR